MRIIAMLLLAILASTLFEPQESFAQRVQRPRASICAPGADDQTVIQENIFAVYSPARTYSDGTRYAERLCGFFTGPAPVFGPNARALTANDAPYADNVDIASPFGLNIEWSEAGLQRIQNIQIVTPPFVLTNVRGADYEALRLATASYVSGGHIVLRSGGRELLSLSPQARNMASASRTTFIPWMAQVSVAVFGPSGDAERVALLTQLERRPTAQIALYGADGALIVSGEVATENITELIQQAREGG